MATEDWHGTDTTRIEPSYMQPVLSTRRRLQNREAQRRYREKAAQKRSWDEGPHEMYLASMSLWDPDRDENVDQGHAGITADLNGEQAWTIESPSSAASSSSSSFPPGEGVSPNKDASLMLDIDLMNPHHGSSTSHTEGQYPMSRDQNQHPGMHNPSPSSLMALYQCSFTEEFPYSTSPELGSGIAQTLEPVEPLLHVAVRSRNRTIVGMLLQHGAAAVGDRNGNGATALHVATKLGDEATVSLLLRHGADVSVRDMQGQDALHLAVSDGHTAIVELMLDKFKITSQNSY